MWRYYASDWVDTKMTTVLTFYNVVLESYISPVSYYNISSVQFSLVSQSCPTLCDHMNCSTPGLPVHHQLPEFTQTHVHRVGDAIQPSHPLSSPSPPAPNPSQHQSFPMSQLFAWGGQSTGVSALASVLPKNTAVPCWSSCEEIPHVQGKRNPSKTVGVARGIRGQTHKP